MPQLHTHLFKTSTHVLACSLMFALSACNSGGSDSSSSPAPSPAATPVVTSNATGVFLDAPVQGLRVERSSGASGTTGALGDFAYATGESVTFYLGTLKLGTVVAKAEITPLDLFNTSDSNNRKVVNLLRLLQSLDSNDNLSNGIQRRQAWWQVRGLDAGVGLTAGKIALDATPELPALSAGETVAADYASLGLTLGPHPLELLRARLAQRRLLTARAIQQMPNGRPARCAGIVVTRQRPDTASGVVFVTLEDETGNTNVIVWSDLVERQRRELLGARLLGVYGVVQREGQVVHLLAKRLVDLSHWLGELVTESRDFK